MTAPSRADVAALLENADGADKLAVMSAAATGLRASEQWALHWRHLDLAAGKVTVVERVDKRGGIDTTKSKAGKRTLPLGKSLVAALTRYRDASKFVDRNDFVFTNNRGGFVRHTNFTKRVWVPLVKKAGLEHFGWHALRQHAVNSWIAAGFQPKEVQTLAGHSSFQITISKYGHMWEKDDHQSKFHTIADTLA